MKVCVSMVSADIADIKHKQFAYLRIEVCVSVLYVYVYVSICIQCISKVNTQILFEYFYCTEAKHFFFKSV